MAHRTLDPAVLAVVALGGIAGAEARYGLNRLWPPAAGHWPLATWVENVSGALLIGALMVVLTELTSPHRLVRPFLGVGVLGGYTTFSTATVEVQELFRAGRPALALGYLVGTVVAAMIAVTLGSVAMRWAAVRWEQGRVRRPGAQEGAGR
ncbi:MAG: fluoride efflux transporter FluC [Blastococcus sp.]